MKENRTRNDRFIHEVLGKLPGFTNTESYFYVDTYEHVLNGYCCEWVPGGAYIWRFRYPLYDNFETLTLLYSKRLEGSLGFIDVTRVPIKKWSAEFISRIDANEVRTTSNRDLNDFQEFLLSAGSSLDHEIVRKSLGYTYVLLGERASAKYWLEKAMLDLDSNLSRECAEVLDLVDCDRDRAKEKVLAIELAMKTRLES